jgi:hypothetical protein
MFPLLLGLLPAIPHVVLGVEGMFGHGNGANKKQAAMGVLGDLVNLAPGSPGAGNSAMMKYLDALVEATVAYLNDSGAMKHAGA